MIGQIRNPLVKQLAYGLIGFCVLTGIVFALIYPGYAKSDEATVSSGIILSMIMAAPFGLLVLLVIVLKRAPASIWKINRSSGDGAGGGCGGGCGGGGCGGGG